MGKSFEVRVIRTKTEKVYQSLYVTVDGPEINSVEDAKKMVEGMIGDGDVWDEYDDEWTDDPNMDDCDVKYTDPEVEDATELPPEEANAGQTESSGSA